MVQKARKIKVFRAFVISKRADMVGAVKIYAQNCLQAPAE